MSRRRAAALAWVGLGLWVGLVAVVAVSVGSGRGTADEVFIVLTIGYAVVGTLVALREPRNAVGWLLLAIGISFGAQAAADAYIAGADPLPGRTAVAWFSEWAWYFWIYLAALVLPLVFPTGRVSSPGWRWVLRSSVGALVLSVVAAALRPGPLEVDVPGVIDNPLGVGGALGTVLTYSGHVADVLVAAGIVLSAVQIVRRLRGARGRERQQLKWFAYVGGLALACLALAMVSALAEPFVEEEDAPTWLLVLGSIGWFGALFLIVLGIPAAVGVAVLRHRLYDIDLVIKRTLVYGSLTAVLVAVYLGLVLTFRLALQPVAGDSDLAVAGSTLAVAGLFRPVRSRIQGAVDRRFFRARYDSQRTLEAFGSRLRDELDLETLGTDLRQLVGTTMAPAHVSLWLRQDAR